MVRRLNPALARAVLGAVLAALVAGALLAGTAPAEAAARVSVTNDRGSALVDGTYATTLSVRGTGFQSVRGGHGGVYVWFGTVSGGWQPSKGGVSGEDYVYVPDSEARENAGHQRYVAFPGSDTASSANGGTMSAAGAWSVELVLPGPVFEAVGRNGTTRSVDCRKVTCGIITVGAHGVKNAGNETFTPVRVGTVYDEEPAPAAPDSPAAAAQPSAQPSAGLGAAAGAGAGAAGAPATGKAPRTAAAAAPALEVDRASARAGHALAFTGTGLPAGRQLTVVFDDGRAAAGPFLVGADGGIAGVVTLPPDTGAGTHELRVFGVENPPVVNFAVTAAEDQAPASADTAADDQDRAGLLFAGACALVLLVVLGRLVWQLLRARRVRRAAA
ncbi:hypothetical protein [Nocardioides pantholopis]|uniref:hypothetical protein n=1 Tax=Nocardioides pantholopis TaxID=2483798 RepID=UPI000F086A51|nr:hypothetical protein [Nocardioides pantholopis]